MPSAEEPLSSPKEKFSSTEDALTHYKSLYEQLEAELTEFQSSSRELEAELEKEVEASDKRESKLREKVESLKYEVDEWKVRILCSFGVRDVAFTTIDLPACQRQYWSGGSDADCLYLDEIQASQVRSEHCTEYASKGDYNPS